MSQPRLKLIPKPPSKIAKQQKKPLVKVSLTASDKDVFPNSDSEDEASRPEVYHFRSEDKLIEVAPASLTKAVQKLGKPDPRPEQLQDLSKRMSRVIDNSHQKAFAAAKLKATKSMYEAQQQYTIHIRKMLEEAENQLELLKQMCVFETRGLRQLSYPRPGNSGLQSLPVEIRLMILEYCLPALQPRRTGDQGTLQTAKLYCLAAFPIASICHSLMMDVLILIRSLYAQKAQFQGQPEHEESHHGFIVRRCRNKLEQRFYSLNIDIDTEPRGY